MAIALERIAEEAEQRTGRLSLRNLELEWLPEELFALTHLQELDLGADWWNDYVGNKICAQQHRFSSFGFLRTLIINASDIADLVLFDGLTGLQQLDCSRTSVSDLSPLRGQSGLQQLDCSDTSVSDLSPLSGLSGLQQLDCSHTSVSDLSPLGGLTSLQELDCSVTSVNDLSPLSGLNGLQELDCSHTSVSDLSPLGGLSSLQELDCSVTSMNDLSPLSGLNGLQQLNCSHTSVSDLSPLRGLNGLQQLVCIGTSVSDLSPLRGLNGLQQLVCIGTSVSDLSPLRGLNGLQELDCSDTSVNDLSPLGGLNGLQQLNCSHTSVSDLSPLRGLNGLQQLDCTGTSVNDLSPLGGLSSLQQLNCSNTSVSDLSPLSGLSSLKRLYLWNVEIPGIPTAGVLSQSRFNNCLDRLRAHWADLAAGEEAVPTVKLLLLGNGRVGKTQIARKLAGLPFESDSVSTHGIRIGRIDLDGGSQIRLHVWDFGGQDIYHGAHALFLSSPALLAVVWAREVEDEPTHEYGGLEFRNQPLPYWLAVAHHHGHRYSPRLVIQTRCERKEQEEARPPAPDALLNAPDRYCDILKVSAQTGRRFDALKECLRDAVDWMRDPERLGVAKVGAGRLRVQRRLEQMRDEDEARPPAERRHRLLTMEAFTAICAEKDDVSSPEALLVWLDAEGTVFHRPGLFHNHVVLDQNWALEAIYAVFDRDRGALQQIRNNNGRFTRDLLDRLVWADHLPADRELFISMMLSCGICFKHREIPDGRERVVEYIAPDLLPAEDSVRDDLGGLWDEDLPTEQAVFRYPLLHDGLIRTIMAEIGEKAGDRALYWKGGLCGYEKTCGSRLRIEQVPTGPESWQGEIRVRTQKGQAALLLDRLIEVVERAQSRIGLRAGDVDHPKPSKPEREETPLVFDKPPQQETAPAGPNWYVSYAWGDDSPEGREHTTFIDDLCAKAKERGRIIRRDKEELRVGDSLTAFMRRIGGGDRIFVILSDRYLRSPNCMFELSEIWRTSRFEGAAFLDRVRVYVTPDVSLRAAKDRAKWAIHWKKEYDELNDIAQAHGPTALGEDGNAELRRMQTYYLNVADILATMNSILRPGNLEELLAYGFDDPPA
ncbi:leucine-rich repeat domain-containing protein [Azospirillum sp. BE72]|uniref:leucine-rich repeat domain-containing protein n=1 Tax=Azospirillum sp. BE72 TaxID=2817776 RepID=UPI002860C84F|nr:leucine-rich repeat domain-containing protein [Azospirillum sp. BE72]MDR6769658.1 internalin A [Azospirillum sp. BE72]